MQMLPSTVLCMLLNGINIDGRVCRFIMPERLVGILRVSFSEEMRQGQGWSGPN